MSRFIPANDFSTSPVTNGGQIIYSRAGSAVNVETGEVVHGSYQVDSGDIISALKALDQIAPTLQCTANLRNSFETMRKDLLDVLQTVSIADMAE